MRRLIDLDALLDYLGITENTLMLYEIKDAVRHGKWIDDKSSIYGDLIDRHCSLCGQLTCSAIDKKMSYCPNCGARMDKGDDNA